MGKNDFSNLGDQIKDIVEDVVDTRNFEQLNKNISDTVNSALDEVQVMLKGGNGERKRSQTDYRQEKSQDDDIYRYKYRPNWDKRNHESRNDERKSYAGKSYEHRNAENKTNGYKERYEWENRKNASMAYRRNETPSPTRTTGAVISKNPPGSVSGILFTVFGSIGTGTVGILIAIFLVGAIYIGVDSNLTKISVGILIPLLVISLFMVQRGAVIRKRVKRFRSYVAQINGKDYSSIKQLASNIGQSEKYVVKDLKKMIHIGMFPQGHIDEQKTCFMVTANMYEQYLKSQAELEKRQQIEEAEQEEDETTKELKKAIAEGKNYILQIKEANDAIPEVELSNKLYRLEIIISKIFDHVEQHPKQMPEIHRFMEYYLPTTLKLVNTYQEFDTQPIQGENISKSKDEIRKTLDTINQAFENLLDSLFEDAAMDVSTDISVLETMLAQEGLTEKDFITK